MKTPYSQVLSIDSINFNYQYKHLSLTRTLGTGASTSLECVTGFLTGLVFRFEQHTVVTATEQTRRSLLSEDFGFAVMVSLYYVILLLIVIPQPLRLKMELSLLL